MKIEEYFKQKELLGKAVDIQNQTTNKEKNINLSNESLGKDDFLNNAIQIAVNRTLEKENNKGIEEEISSSEKKNIERSGKQYIFGKTNKNILV